MSNFASTGVTHSERLAVAVAPHAAPVLVEVLPGCHVDGATAGERITLPAGTAESLIVASQVKVV